MLHTEHLNELTAALAKAQREMQNAKKDAANPFFKSKYADLASVWDAIREPLTSNGLAVIQSMDCDEQGTVLFTILSHSSGQWVGSKVRVNPVKNDPQGLGSAITYMRRYALQAIVGVAPEEDDAEGAMGRGENNDKKEKPKASPKPQQEPKVQSDVITPEQRTRLFTIAGTAKYPKDLMKALLAECGYSSSSDILRKHYDTICEFIEGTPVEHCPKAFNVIASWCKEN